MTYNFREIAESLPLPITAGARRTAWQFSQQQPTPEKIAQVRLNTLAVSAVHDYLQMMGIPTNLKASDTWNPVMRLCSDAADLVVTGLGRLECRYISNNTPTCYVPAEVWEDRIGYVVVQLDAAQRVATILGFAQTVTSEQLAIAQLQPLEALLAHLQQLRQTNNTAVNLSQWLRSAFETGWEQVETLLAPAASPAFSFRKLDLAAETDSDRSAQRVRRAKLIDLGLQLSGHSVALIVEIRPESAEKTGLLLQLHPHSKQTYLPPQLQLTVIDETGATFLEAEARSADNYIQLQFSGRPRERFGVKVTLGEISLTENFVI